MSDLQKTIAVSDFPAKCFEEPGAEYHHRRFLRMLANSGTICLRDSAGNPLNLESLRNGAAHFSGWSVPLHDAKVITQKIEEEAAKRDALEARAMKEARP